MSARAWAASTATAFGIALLACGQPQESTDLGSATWRVDCVAVLGAPPPSARTPLSAVPRSGLPRDKRIDELSSTQIDHLAEYETCLLANGFLRECYTGGGPDVDEGFRAETTVPVSSYTLTCYREQSLLDVDHNAGDFTLEDARSGHKTYFGSCHVASWEDCIREKSWAPFGAPGWGPDCDVVNRECPVL